MKNWTTLKRKIVKLKQLNNFSFQSRSIFSIRLADGPSVTDTSWNFEIFDAQGCDCQWLKLYLRRDKHKDMLRNPVLDVSDLVRARHENSQVVCFQEPDERLGDGLLGVKKEENGDPQSTIMCKCNRQCNGNLQWSSGTSLRTSGSSAKVRKIWEKSRRW